MRQPGPGETWLKIGQEAFLQQWWDGALYAASQHLSQFPNDGNAVALQALAYLEVNRPDLIPKLAHQLDQLNCKTPGANCVRGAAFFHSGRTREALALFREIVRTHPGHPIASDWVWSLENLGQAPVRQRLAAQKATVSERRANALHWLRSCTLVLTSVLLLIGVLMYQGGQRLMELCRRYPSPQQISLADFERTHPTEGWFRITGCDVALPDSVWSEGYRSNSGYRWIEAVCLPVYGTDEPSPRKPRFLIFSRDPKTLGLIGNLAFRDEKDAKSIVEQYPDSYWQRRDVEGTVQADLSSSAFSRYELREKTDWPDDLLVIDESDRPSAASASQQQAWGLMLVLAAIVVAVAGWSVKGKRPVEPHPLQPK